MRWRPLTSLEKSLMGGLVLLLLGQLLLAWLHVRPPGLNRLLHGLGLGAMGAILWVLGWHRRRVVRDERLAGTAWWRAPFSAVASLPPPTPAGRLKWTVLPLLMLAWLPLLYVASSLWPVLAGLMAVACWQQSQSPPVSRLRAGAEQLGWLVADLALLILFPRTGEPGTLTMLGLAAMGSLAWMMLVARSGWRLMWACLFVVLMALLVAADVLHWPWLLPVGVGAGVLLVVAMPWFTRDERRLVAPWPKGHPGVFRLGRRLAWVAFFTVLGWWAMGWLAHPEYSFELGPEDVNHSGPPAHGGDTIVFAVRIGKDDAANDPTLMVPAQWYWRGNVLYTLAGSQWSRPENTGGYNAAFPYPAHTHWKDPNLQFYMVTWAGPLGARVWLDRPVGSDAINGGDVVLPPPSTAPPPPPTAPPPPPPPELFTRDGLLREDLAHVRSWRPWFYPGIAALNEPFQDQGNQPDDMPWALNLTSHGVAQMDQVKAGPLENPRTLQAAQRVYDALPPQDRFRAAAFVDAWLVYLNAHSVYDLERTAAGVTHDVSDAFLFGASPGHGTCVDFATSTVLALRQVGIPARYVTGYVGATWNPYLHTWVVTNGDGHAWVEYFDRDTQRWVRTDPTAAIHRVVRATAAPSRWSLWSQSLTNSHLNSLRATTLGPQKANLLSWLADVPMPVIPLALSVRVAIVISLSLFLMATALVMARRWRRQPHETPAMRRLRHAVAQAQRRLGRHWPAGMRQRHEGLVAWAERVQRMQPEWGDWRHLAQDTQAVYYGHGVPTASLRRRWRVVGRPPRSFRR